MLIYLKYYQGVPSGIAVGHCHPNIRMTSDDSAGLLCKDSYIHDFQNTVSARCDLIFFFENQKYISRAVLTSPSPVTCIQFNERENNILGVACNNGQVSTVQYSTVQYSTV